MIRSIVISILINPVRISIYTISLYFILLDTTSAKFSNKSQIQNKKATNAVLTESCQVKFCTLSPTGSLRDLH